jgi:ABC-type polysaccharide/polyol phosphate transport system ATPase subunit
MRAIEVQGVGKRYRIGANYHLTLRESLTSLVKAREDGREEFWALRDVDFTVDEGEVVGVIGRNGAGKSTLLKILARVTPPTIGVARMRGRVGPLLEVGTGFHLELSGRENIYLNGAILGMTRADIRRRFDDIVAFAGVEEFLDMPVKRYSSGMFLRLAFSVAAHVEPDVVVVDEVLAVGDAEFQRRCLGKMSEFGREGRTVLFVSHDLGAVARICPRAIWLEDGRIVHDGPASRSIEMYLDARAERASYVELPPDPDKPVQLVSVGISDPEGTLLETLRRGEPFAIRSRFHVREPIRGLDVKTYLVTARGVRVLDENLSDRNPDSRLGETAGEWETSVVVPPVLAPGDYVVGVAVRSPYQRFLDREVLSFRIFPTPDATREAAERIRVLQPDVAWEVRGPSS